MWVGAFRLERTLLVREVDYRDLSKIQELEASKELCSV